MSNNEINEHKQLFKKLFDFDTNANDFLNSDAFEFSQQIMKFEHKLNISQEQAANIVNMPLKDFLDFEMGISINITKYLFIIQTLKSELK